MADNRRFYWLKLQEGFFTSKRIKKLRRLAGGDTFTIIYLKMQLLSLSKGGYLEFTGLESSFVEEIALDIDEDVENVQVTIQYLLSCGLLEVTNDKEYVMPYVIENTGSETKWAEKKRIQRQQKDTVRTIEGQCPREIDIDIDNNICSTKSNESASNESKSASLDQLEHDFGLIYDLYPKKVGKAKAFARYKQWVSKSGRKVNGRTYHLSNKQIWLAVKKYVDELKAKDTDLQYYKGFDVLMGDSLLDYLEEGE